MVNLLNCLEPYAREKFLLAVSGGADSLAMYCAAREVWSELFIVHIDHGWRESSAAEAEWLAQTLEGTVHSEKVEAATENGARQARLAVYRRLCREHGYAGVMLAHHADDQAEVVFKRAIEGAGLVRLRAMQPEAVVEGVRLIRPFLQVKREELRAACTLPPIDDPTNRDPKFFRARLREVIFPQIGKGVTRPLLQLAAEAAELSDYFDAKMPPVHMTSGGWWADLSGLARPERRHFLRRFSLSRQQLEDALNCLDKANKKIGPLRLDRGKVYFETPQSQ